MTELNPVHPRRWPGTVLAVAMLVLVVDRAQAGASAPTSPATTTAEPQAAAVVAVVRGEVWIDAAGARPAVRASIGMRLSAGDTVRVAEGAAAQIYVRGGLIVRVPGGNQVEIAGVLAPEQDDRSQKLVRMSTESLKILQDGLWAISGPDGPIVIGGMRGGPETTHSMDDAGAGPTLLSPRAGEVIPGTRPTFYWTSDGTRVRVALGQEDEVIWRGRPTTGGVLRYPEDAPVLRPGEGFIWWLESVDGKRPVSGRASLQLPTTTAAGEIAAFEAEMAFLGKSPDGAELADFLRCGFYNRQRSWTSLLVASHRLNRADAGDIRIADLLRRVRATLELSPEQVQNLILLIENESER